MSEMMNQIDSSGEEEEQYGFDDSIDDVFSTPKLQSRNIVINACWNEEMCMSEVLQHKGGLLISIGIVRNRTVYLSIEETLYLAEIGTLMLTDGKEGIVHLKEIYEKVAEGKGGCSWEYFEVYRYLKSLGYIVGRHNIPWSLKSVRSCTVPPESIENIAVEKMIAPTILDGVLDLLKDLKIEEKNPFFDVYLPDSKFRKTSPGSPVFTVFLARHHPPSISEIEELERQCNVIPLKIVHVEHGRVSFFSFEQVELPTLP